jgi:hypothetical protein
MSQSITDIFSSQNLTRAQTVAGVFGTASRTFNSAANNRDKTAVAGALITQLGGVLNSFNRQNPKSNEGFNISRFISETSKLSGLVNPAHFFVYITPPKWLRSSNNKSTSTINSIQNTRSVTDFGKVLPFLCHNAILPGITMQTASIPHYGYGVAQERPLRPTFENVSMSYYMDNTSVALDFFTKWMQKVVNFDPDATGPKTTDGAFYGEVSYMEEYVTTIDVYVFDAAAARVLNVKLLEAYPKNIGAVRLDWGLTDQLASLDISFTYKSWTSNYLTPATLDKNGLRNLSLGSALIRIGTAAPTLSSLLRRPTGIADIFNTVRTASSVVRSFTG